MPKRSNDFQKLVALINGCLHDSRKVEESALLRDKTSGAEREVDILVSSEIADVSVNMSIEVRDRARKADVIWVEQMYAKHSHLSTDKLVLVSRSGFTKRALDKAAFYGIEAIALQEAFETDWELAAQMTASGVLNITTIDYRCSAVCDHPDGKRPFSPANRNTTVFLPNRDTPTDFDQMAKFFLFDRRFKKLLYKQLDSTSERTFSFDYTPQPGTYVLDADGTEMALLSFRLEIEVDHIYTPIRFATGRYGRREVATGTSSDPDTRLYFAMVRKEENGVEGLLLDKLGLRKIIPEKQ